MARNDWGKYQEQSAVSVDSHAWNMLETDIEQIIGEYGVYCFDQGKEFVGDADAGIEPQARDNAVTDALDAMCKRILARITMG